MSPRDEVTRLGDILERISRIESAEVMLVKAERNENADLRAVCDIELKR